MDEENKATDWEKVVFSDEMSIWLSRGNICLWCKSDKHPVKPTSKYTQKFMFGMPFLHVSFEEFSVQFDWIGLHSYPK